MTATDTLVPPTTDSDRAAATRPGRHPSTTRRLLGTELRLLTRDTITFTFVLAFPVISMLIIGGVFGTEPDEAFPVNPSHWYVASYFTVVIGSTGLIMLPVHMASYRERGVLRRFAASGFPRWSFALAELAIGLGAIAVAGPLLLAIAAPVYGIPDIEDPLRVVAGVVAGSVAFISIGVLLGSVLPSARAAQSVGLMLFFPSFLLGVGGPPPAVMSEPLREVAERLPLALATDAIREPWLGIGDGTGPLIAISVVAVVATALAARRTALS
ncbi:ABC transporter [Nocardioides silvaticus]|uniref:ABC transporter n=1 Tax=Nocardioides silvaticus TaxID=2201891 RepID=A0A316TH90_9ACTN|nr:ABC transporter permease [Nocardioides silvaticus]PWN03158.1 ABC transporter [Nocardioides silvaticus]